MLKKEKKNGSPASVMDVGLTKKLDEMTEDEKVRVLIRMRTRPQAVQIRGTSDIVKRFRQEAKRAQKPLLDRLQGKVHESSTDRQNSVPSNLHSFWLINMVSAELNREQIAEIAKLPGVETITEDQVYRVYRPEVLREEEPDWDNIGAIQAPEVWAMGYRGQNVKVAVIDTGVDLEHPELAGAMGGAAPDYTGYWVEIDENGNPVSGSTPHDSDTHGTHVSGTAIGRNVNMRIGVAPEAVFGHILALPQGSGSFTQLIAGMEWAVENGFQVVNGSWGGSGLSEEFAQAAANLTAAGVFPVFAIGNDGPDETGAPGNTPLAEGVGAFDSQGEVAGFSGGGEVVYPNYTYADPTEKIKPDIVAPGVAITSSVPGGGYETYSGTSMASPHVAGAVALLLSKNPSMTVEEIRQILRESVGDDNDPGAPGKDTRYGWGRLNALQAIGYVQHPADSGIVQGYLQGENEFIANGAVTFTGPEVKTLNTDRHGFFEGFLKAGDYRVTAKATAYLAENGVCSIAAEEKTIRNFVLKAAPLGYIEGTVQDTVTKEPLAGIRVEIPETPIVTVTNEEGRYAVAVKEGKYQLTFTGEGYFPAAMRNVRVRPDLTAKADVQMTFGKSTLRGRVYDEGLLTPLPYTHLLVRGTGKAALTDAKGQFTLDLPAGSYELQTECAGYQTLVRTIRVEHRQIREEEIGLQRMAGRFLLQSSFDAPGDWEEWSAEGGWHLTERRSVTPAYSVWNGLEDKGEYPNNQNAVLRRERAVQIPETGTAVLGFHLWGEIERNYDYLYVTIGDGEERNEIFRYSNQISDWQYITLDLTPFAGRAVIIAFEFTSDYSVTESGVFIDDVYVFHAESPVDEEPHEEDSL